MSNDEIERETRVDQCATCGASAGGSLVAGRLIIGRADGDGLIAKTFCGECWSALRSDVEEYVGATIAHHAVAMRIGKGRDE